MTAPVERQIRQDLFRQPEPLPGEMPHSDDKEAA
jgi:hypothetical protein